MKVGVRGGHMRTGYMTHLDPKNVEPVMLGLEVIKWLRPLNKSVSLKRYVEVDQ